MFFTQLPVCPTIYGPISTEPAMLLAAWLSGQVIGLWLADFP